MYQAIYRRYRPKTFDQIIGQDDVTDLLKSQVDQDKIGHAYLFTGTRGTGKTSCAKIMARAVNCLSPRNGNPCNECENCRAVIDQTSMDVVEMDAASNRRIDDIRELRDQVIFPPASLKYKVYIIDEAHMITKEGFNALLKIMEEPPSHLIFILATTEIEKIPQTILSRCQRYKFKRISREDIGRSISYICQDLGVKIEEEAIGLISRASDGALRDAQSLLDQVLAYSDGLITADLVSDIIGSADRSDIFSLVGAIGQKDQARAISLGSTIIRESGPGEMISSLISHYENLILAKTSPDQLGSMDGERKEAFIDQGQSFDLSELADSITILLDNEQKLKVSSQTRSIGLLTILNLIRQGDMKSIISRIENIEKKLESIDDLSIAKLDHLQYRPDKDLGDRGASMVEDPHGDQPYFQEYMDSSLGGLESLDQGLVPSPSIAMDQAGHVVEDERPSKDPVADQADLEKKQDKNFSESSPSSEESRGNIGSSGLNIFDDWPSFVGEILRLKSTWGLWLNDLRPTEISDGRLFLSIDASENTKVHGAKKNIEDLTKEINDYFTSDFKVIIKEEYKETKEEKSTEDRLRDIFGDKLNLK